MLNPSIDSLMDKLDSKYTLVTVASRRAREIREDARKGPLVHKPISHKAVGMALEEIVEDHLTFVRHQPDHIVE